VKTEILPTTLSPLQRQSLQARLYPARFRGGATTIALKLSSHKGVVVFNNYWRYSLYMLLHRWESHQLDVGISELMLLMFLPPPTSDEIGGSTAPDSRRSGGRYTGGDAALLPAGTAPGT